MSVFLAFVTGTGLALLARHFPLSAWTLALIISLGLFFRFRLIAVLALALGVLLASGRVPMYGERNIPSGEHELKGYFVSQADGVGGGYAQSFAGRGEAFEGEMVVLYSGKPFEIGSRHILRARLLEPEPSGNPGIIRGDGIIALYESNTPQDGMERTPRVMLNRARAALDNAIAASMPKAEGALAASVTTGQRAGLPDDARIDFQRTGLTHLLSISGAHFGFFGVFLFGFFRWALLRLPRRRLERLTERLTPSEAAALMSFPFMIAYLGISGGSVPTVRSFIVMSLFLLGLVLGRRGQWFEFLAVAAFVIVLWDPSAMAGLSFQLSFLSVLFIGFLIREREGAEGPDEELPSLPVRIVNGAWTLVLVTIAATLGTLPLVAYYFHTASLVSPLANFVVTPLVGMLLVPLSLFGALTFFVTGVYVTAPLVHKTASLALWMAHALAEPSFAAIDLPVFPAVLIVFYYAGFFLWFRDKIRLMPLVFLVAAPLALYLAVYALGSDERAERTRIVFLDTGWSDAFVAELPSGQVLVVDTARTGREVAAYLRYRGIRRVDALVLTHPHGDHSGGAGKILREFDVSEIWDAGEGEYPPDWQMPPVRRVLRRGDVLESHGAQVLVLHPYDEFASWSSVSGNTADNNRSLAFRLSSGGASFMFTGDMETDAVTSLTAVPGKWLDSDVLKLPHHGHRVEDIRTLLTVSGPGHVVVTTKRVGERLAVELAAHDGLQTHITGRDGAVKFTVTDGKLEVSAYKDAIMEQSPSIAGELRNIRRLFEVW